MTRHRRVLLAKARQQQLRVRDRDEGALEARAAGEADRCGIELRGVLARDQHYEVGRFVEVYVGDFGCRGTSSKEIAAGERPA